MVHCIISLEENAFDCLRIFSYVFCEDIIVLGFFDPMSIINFHSSGSGMSILCIIALRMVTQLGLQKALEIYEKYFSEKISNTSKSLNNNSLSDEESLIYNLCTHVELREPLDHLKRFFMAFFLFRCLQKSSFFSNEVSETDNHTCKYF